MCIKELQLMLIHYSKYVVTFEWIENQCRRRVVPGSISQLSLLNSVSYVENNQLKLLYVWCKK